jgi:hypothetical protein
VIWINLILAGLLLLGSAVLGFLLVGLDREL